MNEAPMNEFQYKKPVDADVIEMDQNIDFNPHEDEKLFLATGYRYSFALERGFPYPWCAKKHGRKGWVVRNCPPVAYNLDIGTAHSTSTRSVEFKGWKEAEKVLHSRQILMDRFGIQEITSRGNQGGKVTTGSSSENAAKKAIDHWFQQTPVVMKNQRTTNQKVVELAMEKKRQREEVGHRKKQREIEKKRRREEVDQRRKQREELREAKAKEKIERKKQKITEKISQYRQNVADESAYDNEGALIDGSSAAETPPRRKPSEHVAVSSPSRSKRKGNPKRDNKYRDIERSFIENQTLLLSPVKRTPDHDVNNLFSPSTPTRMTRGNDVSNPLPYSPTKTKYKRTQPRKNQQYNSQPSSIILGEDPLMDQMIEDIVKEFTTEGSSGQGHIFDGGAVSALREAAMDMVVHNRGEKNGLVSAGVIAAHSPQGQNTNDPDEKRMEMMIEQLIGEVANDSGCNFEGDAVEAIKIAAREIVTTEGDNAPGTTSQVESPNVSAAVKNGEGKTAEEAEGTSPSNASYHDIPPLQLDNEDSNMSEIGGMIAQLVDDLGKESDVQFDSSAVEALKKASRLV